MREYQVRTTGLRMRNTPHKNGYRRTVRVFCLLTVLILTGLLSGCQPAARPLQKYQVSMTDLFDTVSVFTGYAENERAFSEKVARLADELREYHRLYDIYQEYDGLNNAKTVNDQAGGEAVPVDARLIELLLFAKDLAERTQGVVDVTLGAVLRLWHEAREQGIHDPEAARVPSRESLEEAYRHTGFELLEIDPEACTVRLTDPEASLDLGALAKGYALQRVCESFESGFLVNLGGNVYATGPKPERGEPWTVGVQEPDGTASDFLHVIRLTKGAVVTSGDYQRYYVKDGIRYHHLIDPVTLFPGTRWRAVTVLHEDSGIADGLSTALFLTDRETGEKLLEMYGGEAAWVFPDGTVVTTDGYGARMSGCSGSHLICS